MKKIYLLDTTVILNDSLSIFSFPNEHVIIPLGVIEKVDRFKREMNELGKNAREFNRTMDMLRRRGSLTEGIKLDNGSTLQIVIRLNDDSGESFSSESILTLGKKLSDQTPNKPVVIVSKDLNLRLKANAIGLNAEAYEKDRFDEVMDYTGIHTIYVDEEELEEFNAIGCLTYVGDVELRPNEFINIRLHDSGKTAALAKVASHGENILVPLRFASEDVAGIRPLNMEQTFVMEALLDDNIKLVSLQGVAGTGKTLLAVAAGLRQVIRDFTFNKILVSRPIMPMGKDIGFLPGDIDEKMRPWMQPIFDAVEFIRSTDRRSHKPSLPSNLMEMAELQIEPLTFIRGRSIPNQYMVIDESQNLSPLEIKTIVTRMGKNSKIILTGDVQQIDHPYMDSFSNGLAYVAGRFRDSPLAAHIQLRKGERSELAEAAVELL